MTGFCKLCIGPAGRMKCSFHAHQASTLICVRIDGGWPPTIRSFCGQEISSSRFYFECWSNEFKFCISCSDNVTSVDYNVTFLICDSGFNYARVLYSFCVIVVLNAENILHFQHTIRPTDYNVESRPEVMNLDFVTCVLRILPS